MNKSRRLTWFIAGVLITSGCAKRCYLKKDEQVTFFPTYGYNAPDHQAWIVPVHGWVYKPEPQTITRKSVLKLLNMMTLLSDPSVDADLLQERLKLFWVESRPGLAVPIQMSQKPYALGKSGEDGHFEQVLTIQKGELAPSTPTSSGSLWVEYKTPTCKEDPRVFAGKVQLIPEEGVSVISDVDGTILAMKASNRSERVTQLFLRDFVPVAGMAGLYRGWQTNGVTYHYISATPWQLYPVLSEFLESQGFPAGTLHLKRLPLEASSLSLEGLLQSFSGLMNSSAADKSAILESLLQIFPRRQFILIGSTAEKDPEIYGALTRKHPKQIQHIYIRETGPTNESDRLQNAFNDIPPQLWKLFHQPPELSKT